VYENIDKELLCYVEDVLLNRCSNATERLLTYADTIEPKCKPCAPSLPARSCLCSVSECAALPRWDMLCITLPSTLACISAQ
jgi:hypothetical protein